MSRFLDYLKAGMRDEFGHETVTLHRGQRIMPPAQDQCGNPAAAKHRLIVAPPLQGPDLPFGDRPAHVFGHVTHQREDFAAAGSRGQNLGPDHGFGDFGRFA